MFFAKRYAYDCAKEKDAEYNVSSEYNPTDAEPLNNIARTAKKRGAFLRNCLVRVWKQGIRNDFQALKFPRNTYYGYASQYPYKQIFQNYNPPSEDQKIHSGERIL